MLYSMIMTLKSNLKDNFDGHVLNFTIYKILESTSLETGQLDYCIPLLLPPTID